MKFIRALIGVVFVGGVLAGTIGPASASFSPSDFPTTNDSWERYLTKNVYNGNSVVGARPARCASDTPFTKVLVRRSAYYNLLRQSAREPSASASVTLYKFGSRGKARAALKKVKRHVLACPSYTEWVCTNCDGIWDVWQQLASIPNVGDRTVAWAGRTMGNVGERFRTAAVLDRNYVIEVQLSIGKDAGGSSRFPSQRPPKSALREWAEAAYNSLP